MTIIAKKIYQKDTLSCLLLLKKVEHSPENSPQKTLQMLIFNFNDFATWPPDASKNGISLEVK